jgi:putative protease
VKNVVAAYSLRLDTIIAKHQECYQRASLGRCTYLFTPDLKKTFNRGFTDYFLHATHSASGELKGRRPDISSFDTPKAMGEYVGRVKEIRGRMFTVAGTASFANGDGLCFSTTTMNWKGSASIVQKAIISIRYKCHRRCDQVWDFIGIKMWRSKS